MTAKNGACCALSVERIALAVLMSELTIGAVHFDNGMALRLQKARETRVIRSSPLDTKSMDRTERSRPRFEILLTLRAYGDCEHPKMGADPIDCDSDVDVFVGINADDDFDRVGLAHVEGSPEVRT